MWPDWTFFICANNINLFSNFCLFFAAISCRFSTLKHLELSVFAIWCYINKTALNWTETVSTMCAGKLCKSITFKKKMLNLQMLCQATDQMKQFIVLNEVLLWPRATCPGFNLPFILWQLDSSLESLLAYLSNWKAEKSNHAKSTGM